MLLSRRCSGVCLGVGWGLFKYCYQQHKAVHLFYISDLLLDYFRGNLKVYNICNIGETA